MQIGPYRVLGELGSGGMGAVYRAQRPDGLQVALKVLHPGTLDAELVERFRREASLLRGIEHPHLVRVLDVSVAPPLPYAAFELVEGGTLEAKVLREGPCDWRSAIQIVAQISAGVAAAHERGLLHRDIKPANVLLGEAGAKLADFGLVKDLNRDSLTQSGTTLGTPGYLAPEQIGSDKDRWGPSTDVYGLAATLYFALTGRPPFRGGSTLATLEQVVNEPAPAPRKLNPGVPPWLEALCLRGLAKLNRDRYRDALTFRAALLHGAPAAPGRLRPRLLAGAAVAGCVGLGAGGWVLTRAPTRADVEPIVATTQREQDPRTGESEPRPHPAELTPEQRTEAVARTFKATSGTVVEVARRHAARQARAALEEADEALNEGKLPLALGLFDKALKHAPTDARTHRKRGWARYKAGQFRAADSDFARAIELDPEEPEAHFQLGMSLQRQARYEESLPHFAQAIELAPAAGLYWAARALSLQCLSRFADAQRGNEEALRRDLDRGVRGWVADSLEHCLELAKVSPTPDSVNALIARSDRALKGKLYEETAQLATEALARHPELVVPHLLRSQSRLLQGKTRQAFEDFDKAIGYAPGDVRILLRRATALRELGQPELALKDCDRALEFVPTSAQAFLHRARAQQDLGQHLQAFADANRAREREPDNPEALALFAEYRGVLRITKGEQQGALADFSTALKHTPNNLDVLRRRGSLLRRMRKPSLALQDFEQILRRDPGNVVARTEKGRCLLTLGKVTKALKAFGQDGLYLALRDLDSALERKPFNVDAYQARGSVRYEAGQFHLAEQDLERAIELEPGDAMVHHYLGLALQRQARYEESLPHFARAIELEPENANHYASRALSFQCLSQPSEAREDLNEVLRRGKRTNVEEYVAHHQGICARLEQAIDAPPRVDALLAESMERLGAGHYDAATRSATEALRRHPELVEARVVRAHARWALQDAEGAFEDWDYALKHAPGELKILLARAQARWQLKQPKLVLEDCDRALQFEPEHTDARFLRAIVHMQLGQGQQAVADLDWVLQQDPLHGEARTMRSELRGVLRFRAGDQDGALEDLTDALKHAPDNLNALRHRGLVLLARDEPLLALEDLERALELHPQDLAAGAGKADALIRLGRRDEALETLNQGTERGLPDVRTYRSRGWSFLELEQGMLALRNFKRALKHADASLAADHAGLGQALQLLGRPEEAVAEFDRALKLTQDPGERSELQAQRGAALAGRKK